GLPVLVRDRGIVDLERAQADGERAAVRAFGLRFGSGSRGRLGRRASGDVPVGGAVLEDAEVEDGLVQFDGAHDDWPVAEDAAQHAGQAEDEPKAADGGERVPREGLLAADGQAVEPDGDAGEAAEGREADAAP